jgi:glycosyltransferase involved in cell wall biosynthesis
LLVCHVWERFPPLVIGGIERYILELSRYLSESDHEIRFMLLTDRSFAPFRKILRTTKNQHYPGLDVYRLGPTVISPIMNLIKRMSAQDLTHPETLLERVSQMSLCSEAINLKRTSQADIFHLHGIVHPGFTMIGLKIAQRFSRPFIVSLHGDTEQPPYGMPMKDPRTISVLRGAKAVLTYSPRILRLLNAEGLDNKTHLVPNFVDTEAFRKPSSLKQSNGTNVIIITRLDVFKDPVTQILAFKQAARKMPEAHLKVVGDGPLYVPIQHLIKKERLENNVTILGKQEDVRRYLWSSDILMTGDAYLTILEAWSAGLAVVAIDAETTRNLIDHRQNGILVPPKNPQKLADALLEVMQDARLRNTLRLKGMHTVKRYDIRNVAGTIQDMYKKFAGAS